MKNAILNIHKNRFWEIGELKIYDQGLLLKTVPINKFYDYDQNWFFTYEANGGSGYGYTKGAIIRKVFIGDCEFELNYIKD